MCRVAGTIQEQISKANQAGQRQRHHLYLYFLPRPQFRPKPKLRFCLERSGADNRHSGSLLAPPTCPALPVSHTCDSRRTAAQWPAGSHLSVHLLHSSQPWNCWCSGSGLRKAALGFFFFFPSPPCQPYI